MKKFALAVVAGGLFSSGIGIQLAHAQTTDIVFDTNGAAVGGEITVRSFDWTQDNALAVGATPLSLDPENPTTFTLYAQGSLGNFKDGNNQVINGTGLNIDYEITFETGFTETGVNSIIDGIGALATFQLASETPVNYFNIYYDTARNASQLAGTGYNDGDLIMHAEVTKNDTTFFVAFQIDADEDGVMDTPLVVALDGNGTDNYPGVGTVDGSGGGKLEGSVVTADTNFFKSDFSQLVIDLFFNTSIITPFLQADPAALVAGFTPQYGGAVPGFSFTSVNGLGGGTCDLCDFQFQADANQSFSVAAVPEPNTLALLGCALGVAGLMGGVGRRYRRV